MAAVGEIISRHVAATPDWPRFGCVGLVGDVVEAVHGVRPDFSVFEGLTEAEAVTRAVREYWTLVRGWGVVLSATCQEVHSRDTKPGDVLIFNPGLIWSGGQRWTSDLRHFPGVVGEDMAVYAWLVKGCRRIDPPGEHSPSIALRMRPRPRVAACADNWNTQHFPQLKW